MDSFINFCELGLLAYLLFSLLPLLLGLFLGWAIWGRWRRRAIALEEELKESRKEGKRLEKELEECRKSYHQVDNENAMLRGQLRELRQEIQRVTSESSETKTETPEKPDEKLESADSESSTVVTPADPDTTSTDSIASKLRSDNLQIFEGIGPKMETFLNEHGIDNWQSLAGKTGKELKALLESSEGKYRIIDPSSWPVQAGLAAEGDWEGLIAFQKGVDGKGDNQSKLEKLLSKMGLI